jgi:hypothetical protein
VNEGSSVADAYSARTPLVEISRSLPATYRPSATRATVAMTLVGIAVGAYLVQLVLTVSQFGLFDAAVAGTLSSTEAAASDARLAQVSGIATLTHLASAVAVLAWLWRAVGNVLTLTARTPRWSRNEAVGWWFVPLANWVMPYQVVRDTFADLARSRPGRIITAWWICHVASSATAMLLVAGGSPVAPTIDDLRGMVALSSAMLALEATAGVLLVLVIRRMTALARLLEHGVAKVGTPGPADATLPGETRLDRPDERFIETVVASGDGPVAPPPPPA